MIKRTIDRFNHWRVYRSTFKSLNSLDDHLLNDIGITRWQIGDVARGKHK